MVLNKTLMHAAEEFLEPFCSRNQLSVGQAIQLLPGETNQPIHRDRWAWMGVQGVETQFNSMLAVTDFTAENGATVVAPGSQTWPNKRRPEECQITQGVMRKGSVLASTGPFFTGRNKSLGRA
jgi:ectoine hydroxylase-related dioxygenase (phytanoyl-CoA dioxygenase family)